MYIFHTIADLNIGDMLGSLHLPLIITLDCKSTSLTSPVSPVIYINILRPNVESFLLNMMHNN